jgi:phosphohistidine phosphatase
MPQLLLMRHGKAVERDRAPDRERRLTARGRRDSEAMGRVIGDRHTPDRILCSPSARTRETLDALMPSFSGKPDVWFVEGLYDPPGDYTGLIAANAARAQRLLVIGHNPAIQETTIVLMGTGDPKIRGAVHEKFPTSAVAVIDLDRDWRDVQPLSGKLVAFLTP